MANQSYPIIAQGFSAPLVGVFSPPVLAKRAPLTKDTGYQIGQLWMWPSKSGGGVVYILISIISNSATWQQIATNGTAATFSSLTVTPGPTSITGIFTVSSGAGNAVTIGNDATDHSVTIGSTSGASAMVLNGGTSGIVASTSATGIITLGSAAMTGAITLGLSTAGQTVNISNGVNTGAQVVNIASGASGADSTVNIMSSTATAGVSTLNLATGAYAHAINIGSGAAVVNTIVIGGTGANVITIGDTQTAGSISIGAAMTSGTLNLGSTGAGVGTMTIAGGTGAQTVNIAASGTGAKTIAIGATGSVDVITMGSSTGASSLTLKAGSAGISLASAGNVKMTPGTVSAAAYAATLSTQVGQVTLTSQTLASSGVQVLTITNTLCTTTTPIFVSVDNLGTNDAQLTIQRVQLQAGSFLVTVKNNGAAALNGDIHVNFWLLS